MDESQLAIEIAKQVASDTKFWVAIVGLIGVVIGGIITVAGNFLLHHYKEKPQKELDKARIEILTTMLEDERFPEKWRNLSTLSSVIGASDEETKRLLIKSKARGSEKADGKWGLIKHHPFPGQQ